MADRSHCGFIGFPDRSVSQAECVQRIELDRNANNRASQAEMRAWLWNDSPYDRYRYPYERYRYPYGSRWHRW